MFRSEFISITWAVGLAACAFFLSTVSALPAGAAVNHDILLRDRLNEVRELLGRRQAHRDMLSAQIDAWSSKLDQLQLERNAALATVSGQIDRTRTHERELDRLIPKLLPRLVKLEKLRKQGARAIADVAKMGRDANVEARAKSRFLAAKTVTIDQMRRASTSVRLLRRLPNDLISQHRDLDFQIPLLERAADQASNRQDRLQRKRDRAIRHIAELSVDIERLTAEEHRISRNMLARSLTAASTIKSRNKRRISADRRNLGKVDIGRADIKGTASASAPPRTAIIPLDEVTSEALQSVSLGARTMPSQAAEGKAMAPAGDWTGQAAANRLIKQRFIDEQREFAALEAEPLSSFSSRVARGRIEESHPLVPTGETIGYTLSDVMRQTDQPAIEIPAAPFQRVAAPDDGVVVFANDFRSYGLLLIIEHGSEYHTLLWGFSSLDTKLGEHVRAGQIVGTAGTGQSPKLHVELRRNGEPVSPKVWLAANNSGVEG